MASIFLTLFFETPFTNLKKLIFDLTPPSSVLSVLSDDENANIKKIN